MLITEERLICEEKLAKCQEDMHLPILYLLKVELQAARKIASGDNA